jgi:hypothetical protein
VVQAATFGGTNSLTVNTNSSGVAASPVPAANNTAGSYSVTASVAGVATTGHLQPDEYAGNHRRSRSSVPWPRKTSSRIRRSEVGVKFRSDVSGTITGIRFYKGSTDQTTHTGSLWSVTGTLLASGTFQNETASGWQQMTFSTPVSIVANTTYVASYHTGKGYFASENYFQNASFDNAPLHALRNGVDGINGVFAYGAGGIYPTQGFQSNNYWADVVFVPAAIGPPQAIVAVSGTPQTTTVGMPFAVALQAKVTDASANPVANVPVTFTAPSSGASATFGGTNSVTVNTNGVGVAASPVPAANNTVGSYSVTASVSGVATPATFSLTNTPPNTAVTIFGTLVPQTFFSQTIPAEVGLKFRSDVNGTITGIRFYKGAADATTHTGSLWSAAGALLATGHVYRRDAEWLAATDFLHIPSR